MDINLAHAKLIDNFDLDATGGGKWTDTTHYKALVPTGKRWFLIGGVVNRDVSGTMTVRVLNSSDQIVLSLDSEAAAAALTVYPNNALNVGTNGVITNPITLDPGWYVYATFGAAQSTAAYATAVVLEIDV